MIDSHLAAFADHCNRHTIARRPNIWVRFVDVWGEPKGEIGLPDATDETNAAFSLMIPWAMVPTLAEAWLVVDHLDYLQVMCLKVSTRGMFNPTWKVPYKMADDGCMSFGEPIRDAVPGHLAAAVQGVKRARRVQAFWESEHSIESLMPIVEALLDA